MMNLSKITNNASIKHLVSFVRVAEEGSFTSAANSLHLTQSTLTTQIKQLESNIGLDLFDRTTRSVELTSVGESFLPVAKRLLNDFQTAMEDLYAQANLDVGMVKLAASPSIMSGILPNSVKKFRDQNPNVHFLMREETAEHIEDLVRDGSVDFGIGGNHSNHPDLSYVPLLTDQYGIVSLDEQGQASWQTLMPEKFIWLSIDNGIRRELMQFFRQHHLSIDLDKTELETSSTAAMAAMVKAGLGMAVIPAMAASTPTFDSLTFTPIEEPKLLRTIYLIQRVGRSMPPASASFVAVLKKHLQARPLPDGVNFI